MFCSKCGNPIKDGERFCTKCGAKNIAVENPTDIRLSPNEIVNQATHMKDNFVSGIAEMKQNKMFVLGNIALLILSMIFSCIPAFQGRAFIASECMSLFFDGMESVQVFCIVFYLFAAFMLLYPLLFRKAWKRRFIVPSQIITIALLVWFFILFLVGINETNSSGYGSIVSFEITASGWLFLLTTIGAFILSCKNSHDIKKSGLVRPVNAVQPPDRV